MYFLYLSSNIQWTHLLKFPRRQIIMFHRICLSYDHGIQTIQATSLYSTHGMLIGRSRDARPESGDTTEVMTSNRVRKCDRSREVQLESGYMTRVGHTTKVTHMSEVKIYIHYNHV
jgi:hypothetical protein